MELGLSFENKGELSVRDDVINFAFHQIYGESNMEKKLGKSKNKQMEWKQTKKKKLGVGLEVGRLESSQCERQGTLNKIQAVSMKKRGCKFEGSIRSRID